MTLRSLSLRRALWMSAALALLALPAQAADETREAWRVFVTDQAAGRVTALDPVAGEVLGVFPTAGYVTHLTASDSGATLFAVQMDHDMVQVLDSGLRRSDHGDHADLKLGAPRLLPVELAGGRPVHTVPHGDEMVQFFDRDGVAQIYHETALLAGDTGHETVRASAPVHGVAVPMGNYMLMAEPDLAAATPAGELPPRFGLSVLDRAGVRVGVPAVCTGLHGEAASAGVVAFGCAEGVLLATPQPGGAPKLTLLPYGTDLPAGQVSTLLGGKALQVFLGNYGDSRVAIIDIGAETPFHIVDLPVRRVDFALDPARATTAYVFTEDGRIHALDLLSGALTRSARITGPYSKDGHWRAPRPRLAVMGDAIAVSDPQAGLVRVLDAATFAERRTIPVEGLPFTLVAVGGSGLDH